MWTHISVSVTKRPRVISARASPYSPREVRGAFQSSKIFLEELLRAANRETFEYFDLSALVIRGSNLWSVLQHAPYRRHKFGFLPLRCVSCGGPHSVPDDGSDSWLVAHQQVHDANECVGAPERVALLAPESVMRRGVFEPTVAVITDHDAARRHRLHRRKPETSNSLSERNTSDSRRISAERSRETLSIATHGHWAAGEPVAPRTPRMNATSCGRLRGM